MAISSTKAMAAAAALVFTSAVVLASSPHRAQAAPCQQYGFDGNTVIIEDGTGWTVSFEGKGQSLFGLPAYATNSKTGESPRNGITAGGFTSPIDISMKITYPEGVQVYNGKVDSYGRARGVTAQPPFDGINWQIQNPLLCFDESGAPAAPQKQAPPPDQAPPPEQAPTNAITVNFSDTPSGLVVNVNNLAKIAATCTYDATAPNSLIPPTHRDFTMGPTGAASLQISGVRTGTTFNTVTVCRGNFQGKDVEIGRVEIPKTF